MHTNSTLCDLKLWGNPLLAPESDENGDVAEVLDRIQVMLELNADETEVRREEEAAAAAPPMRTVEVD